MAVKVILGAVVLAWQTVAALVAIVAEANSFTITVAVAPAPTAFSQKLLVPSLTELYE